MSLYGFCRPDKGRWGVLRITAVLGLPLELVPPLTISLVARGEVVGAPREPAVTQGIATGPQLSWLLAGRP